MSKAKLKISEPQLIADNVYFLGVEDAEAGFHFNHYLLVDGKQGILFNTGGYISAIDTFNKFASLLSVNKITHAVITGNTPELTSAAVVIENRVRDSGGQLTIIAHPRTSHRMAYYYGLSANSFHLVDHGGWRLTLDSGRVLRFIPANNIGQSASFMTFDETTGILFSGELFSGYSFGWSLYANDFYLPAMEAYHYDYLPFAHLLKNTFDGISGLGVKLIAPNHGSLINKDIPMYVEAIKNVKKPHRLFRSPDAVDAVNNDHYVELA